MRVLSFLLTLSWAACAHGFCGFYVGSAKESLVNNATQVVLMRQGEQTVLSMRNDYQGPAKAFALVVPVPVVLKPADVKTLSPDIFDRIDRLAAPRLVEYWEQDPCQPDGLFGLGVRGTGAGGGGGYGRGAGRLGGVWVEAEFSVGEYEIVILSASDSAGLDTWLRANRYNIPAGAATALAPYVKSGMKFFVARVNPKKVKFKKGRAVLSPLRVAYQSADFRLPVRLGLLNAQGDQDLVVHVLSPDSRYEVANYPNVTIPTNLDVTDAVRDRFGAFYGAVFDKTLAQHPKSVVTEYAWQASKCDPCPGPTLTDADIATLGGDRLTDVARPQAVRLRWLRDSADGGTVGDQVVRRMARRYRRQTQYCFDKKLRQAPRAVRGRLVVDAMVDAQGRMESVKVSETPMKEAASCVHSTMKRWRWPAGKKGAIRLAFMVDPIAGSGLRARDFVLTRLHARYSADSLGEDLVFAPAKPIVGGREHEGSLSLGQGPSTNAFQARYAIRHAWDGPIQCAEPRRGIWGARPGGQPGKTKAAAGMPSPRTAFDLRAALPKGAPSLGIQGPATP